MPPGALSAALEALTVACQLARVFDCSRRAPCKDHGRNQPYRQDTRILHRRWVVSNSKRVAGDFDSEQLSGRNRLNEAASLTSCPEATLDAAYHRCLVAHYRHDADGNKSGKSKGTCTGLGQAERVLHAHLDKFAHLVDRRDGAMVENVTRLLSPRLLTLELGRSRRGES